VGEKEGGPNTGVPRGWPGTEMEVGEDLILQFTRGKPNYRPGEQTSWSRERQDHVTRVIRFTCRRLAPRD